MKRRIAATAATAALAVASPATAARTTHVRAPAGGKERVSGIAGAESIQAEQSLDALRREERREQRRRLAAALAIELPAAGEPDVERGLRAAETGGADIALALARSTGASEEQIEAAFEAMARRALAQRLDA